MVSYHHHVERLFGRFRGVGPRWSWRGRNDVGLTAHFDNVRSMPATSPFGVKGVNGSTLERGDGIFDKAAFVQCIGVDKNLDIHLIRDRKAAINGGASRAPVLIKLQAARPSFDLLNDTRRGTRIAFAKKPEIQWKA